MATHDPNNPTAPPVAPAAGTYKRPAVDPLDTHAPHEDEHPEHHEHTDVKIKPLAWTFVALCVLGIVGHGGLYLLHRGYQRAQDAENRQEQKSAVDVGPRVPPEGVPKIQGVPGYNAQTPVQDMKDWRALEQSRLTKAEPGTRTIDEAIDLALKQGAYKQQPKEPPEGRGSPGRRPEPPPFRIPGAERPATEGSETPTPADTPPGGGGGSQDGSKP